MWSFWILVLYMLRFLYKKITTLGGNGYMNTPYSSLSSMTSASVITTNGLVLHLAFADNVSMLSRTTPRFAHSTKILHDIYLYEYPRVLYIPRYHFCEYTSVQWRHNGRDGYSNQQPHDCLLNHLLTRRSRKTSKLRVTGLCQGNSPMTGEFPTQRTSNAGNVSISWRHHARRKLYTYV